LGERRNASTWNALKTAQDGKHHTSGADYDRGFTGHEMLDDFGIIHMNGRIYDPELGRFLSADPYVMVAKSPWTGPNNSYVPGAHHRLPGREPCRPQLPLRFWSNTGRCQMELTWCNTHPVRSPNTIWCFPPRLTTQDPTHLQREEDMECRILSALVALFLCACSTYSPEKKTAAPNPRELSMALDHFFTALGKQNVQTVLKKGVDEASLKAVLSRNYQVSLWTFSRGYTEARGRFADRDLATIGRTVTDEINVAAMRPWPYLYVPQTVEVTGMTRKEEAVVAEIRFRETRWHDTTNARASAIMVRSGNAWVLDDLLWLDDPVGKSNRVRIAGLTEAIRLSSDPATFDVAAKQYR
jgi:RHS repeat-associated protein